MLYYVYICYICLLCCSDEKVSHIKGLRGVTVTFISLTVTFISLTVTFISLTVTFISLTVTFITFILKSYSSDDIIISYLKTTRRSY